MKKILMTMVFCSVMFAGCDPAEIPGTPYNGPDYVYFYIEGSGDLSSNVTKGFSSSYTQPISVTRTVKAVGKLVDYDRTFKITASMDPSMGSEHDISRLVEIEEDTYTIKAGETSAEVNFKLLNDGEYLSRFKTEYLLTNIKIVPTDDFALGFEYQTLIYRIWVSGSYQ